MKFPEIILSPEAQVFFDSSKISFSGAILEKAICHLRSNLHWDCGLFLLSIFNIFIATIETFIRAIIFAITALFNHPQENDALFNLIYSSSTIYFSAKFVGMSLFRTQLDYQTIRFNDPVHIFTTKHSYKINEVAKRTN